MLHHSLIGSALWEQFSVFVYLVVFLSTGLGVCLC